MDEAPSKLGTQELEPLPDKLKAAAERLPWVCQADVRLREHGHLVTGEIFLVPRDDEQLVPRIEAAADALSRIDWRLHSLVIMPVSRIDEMPARRE